MHWAVRIQLAQPPLKQRCGEQGQGRAGMGWGFTPQLGSARGGALGKAGATSHTGPFALPGSRCVAR